MSGRPGRISLCVDVNLPRPRRSEITMDPEFLALKQKLLKPLEEAVHGNAMIDDNPTVEGADHEPGVSRARRISERVLPPLLFAVFVLVVWQLYVVLWDVKESTLPPPTAVAQATLGRTAACWPRTPGSRSRRSCSASPWRSSSASASPRSSAPRGGSSGRSIPGWSSPRWCRSRRSPRSW